MITYDNLQYDQYFKELLQRDIKLLLNSKVIRQGRLMLYSFKNFNIELYFKTNKSNNQTRKTDIPIPFAIHSQDDIIILDYSLESLFPNMKAEDIKPDLPNTDSKFFNSKVKIKITGD